MEEKREVKSDKPIDDQAERRAYRRRRRIRNQIIAYIVAIILLAGIVAGADYGIRQLMVIFQEWQAARVAETPPEEEPPPEDIFVAAEPEDTVPEDDGGQDDDPPEEEQPAPPSALDVYVDERIAALTLAEKVAGLFFITPEALTGTSPVVRAGETTRARLDQYPVGGLVYFSANIQSAGQLGDMLANTREMSKYPIFLAVDEEGGRVARVAGARLADNTEPMGAIGASGDPAEAAEAGRTIGTYLAELGFDLNFAPVADVLTDAEAHPLGDRSFGFEPWVVESMVTAFISGSAETGVHTAVKHFPGLGSAMTDTHDGMAIGQRSLEDMRGHDLVPFTGAISAGVPFVMVGHISLPDIIGNNTPASLSAKMISEVLRGEMGFDGIVITDALNMGAISEYYDADEAAIQAIEAGVDMLLMPEDFAAAYDGVMQAVAGGRISEERIDESLRRIYRVKYADAAGGE